MFFGLLLLIRKDIDKHTKSRCLSFNDTRGWRLSLWRSCYLLLSYLNSYYLGTIRICLIN